MLLKYPYLDRQPHGRQLDSEIGIVGGSLPMFPNRASRRYGLRNQTPNRCISLGERLPKRWVSIKGATCEPLRRGSEIGYVVQSDNFLSLTDSPDGISSGKRKSKVGLQKKLSAYWSSNMMIKGLYGRRQSNDEKLTYEV